MEKQGPRSARAAQADGAGSRVRLARHRRPPSGRDTRRSSGACNPAARRNPAWLPNVRAMAAHALDTRGGGLTVRTFFEATQSQDELDDVLAELQGLP